MRPRRDLDSTGGKRPLLSLGPPDAHLRLPGWRVYYDERLKQSPTDVVLTAESILPFKNPCAKCLKVGGTTPNWVRYGFKWQKIHDLSMRGDRIMIRVLRRRYQCATCKSAVWEPLPGRHAKRKATDRLVKYVEQACATRPFADIAQELGISDRTVRRIFAEYRKGTAPLSGMAPVWLGIDEVKLGGHTYAVLSDLREKRFLDLLPNTKDSTLQGYLKELSDKERTQYVCMDLEKSYRRVVRRVFPRSTIVIDKFHVMRHLNAVIYAVLKTLPDSISQREVRKLGVALTKRRQRTPKILAPWIERWFAQVPQLKCVWEAKEHCLAIWGAKTGQEAEERYQNWRRSLAADVTPWFQGFISDMEREGKEILNYFRSPLITNAFTEVTNRLIRKVHRMGHGYTFDVLRAKVHQAAAPKEKVRQVFDRRGWKSWEEIEAELRQDQTVDPLRDEQEYDALCAEAVHERATMDSEGHSLLFMPEPEQTSLSQEDEEWLAEHWAQNPGDQHSAHTSSYGLGRFDDELPDLSKSKYINGRQCPKFLYYELYERHKKARDTHDQHLIKIEGNFIGDLARRYWPKGVLVDVPYTEKAQGIRETRRLLEDSSVPAIFEAGFRDGPLYARADILERRPKGQWRLIEVKSVKAVKESHVEDVAFQAHVLEAAGMHLEGCFVMHLNPALVWPGRQPNIRQLFVLTDVTERVRRRQASIPGEIKRLLPVRLLTEAPSVAPGPHCEKPRLCDYWAVCTKHHPPESIVFLPNSRGNIQKLMAQGIHTSDEIPEENSDESRSLIRLSSLQRRFKAGIEWMSSELAAELESKEGIPHFMYLGTSFPGIPLFPGMMPRMQMILHWALQEAGEEDAQTLQEAICLDRAASYEQYLKGLLLPLAEGKGNIYVYTPFERGCLAGLTKVFPQLQGWIWPVYRRIKVLSTIMRKHYYAPGIDKRYSLPSVIHALGLSLDQGETLIHDDVAVAPLRKAFLLDAPKANLEDICQAMKAYARQRLVLLRKVHAELTSRAGSGRVNVPAEDQAA